MVFMSNTNKAKTISAWEVQKGDKVQVNYKGKTYVITVEWLKQYADDCKVSLWGESVLSFIGASEAVILLEREAN
jgi:hypothetical protein